MSRLSSFLSSVGSKALGILVVVVFAGWVLLYTFNSCVTVGANPSSESPASSELATDENIRALTDVIVRLHERIEALEVQQVGNLYPDATHTHTHTNDHYHSSGDSMLDPGYHSHFGYAEAGHDHWGYAEEFHSHDRGW